MRDITAAPVMECKRALKETAGDVKKAEVWLRKREMVKVKKKKDREVKEGVVHSYIHSDAKTGVLVKLCCESDFVARNKAFIALAHEIAMQAAAMKPKNAKELLSQEYIRDPKKKVEDLVNEAIAKFGENIKLEEFARLEIQMDPSESRGKMRKALEAFKSDLATIKVGRARPALVEQIKVAAYEGTVLELRELANITASDSQQIVISPWDKSIIRKISQAISELGLNLNPVVEGEIIRIRIPPLTEERKKEMEKLIHVKVERGRKMVRMIRNDVKSEIERLKGESGFSEDDIFRSLKDLQDLHNEFIEKIEGLGEAKRKEIGL